MPPTKRLVTFTKGHLENLADGTQALPESPSEVDFDRDIQPYLHVLTLRSQDIMTLYFKHKKCQWQIALMLGLTQGAISTNIRLSIKKLHSFKNHTDFDYNKLKGILNKKQIKLCMDIQRTSSQSVVSKETNTPQCTIAVRLAAIEKTIHDTLSQALTQLQRTGHHNKALFNLSAPHRERSKVAKFDKNYKEIVP